MTRKQLIVAMKREQKNIAKARDKLRDLKDEAENIFEDAEDGIDSLEYAIEALSRNQ